MAIESTAAAKQLLLELRNKLAWLEQEKAELIYLIQGIEKHAGIAVENAPYNSPENPAPVNGRATIDLSILPRGRATVAALQIVNHPMTTKEVADYLQTQGVDLSGKN